MVHLQIPELGEHIVWGYWGKEEFEVTEETESDTSSQRYKITPTIHRWYYVLPRKVGIDRRHWGGTRLPEETEMPIDLQLDIVKCWEVVSSWCLSKTK